jgi:hypothetical protein
MTRDQAKAELARVVRELDAIEDKCFVGSQWVGDLSPADAVRQRQLIERIVALEPLADPDLAAERKADAEHARIAELPYHHRQVEEQLKREWERWRYRRSKLPPDKRRRTMMTVGQRECRYCGACIWPTTLRQRYHTGTCRKLARKRRRKGS